MTEETAEKNNVVAAVCCKWCSYYEGCQISLEGECSKLKTKTWSTDVCDHFTTERDSMKKTDKEDKYVVSVTVSIPKDMFEKLQNKAKEDFRDLNMEILYAIDKMLTGTATVNYPVTWQWINNPNNTDDKDPNKWKHWEVTC